MAVNDALNFVFALLNYFVNFVFNAEVIPGVVTLGWLFVCTTIFTILLRYAVAIPRVAINSMKNNSRERKEDE